MQNNWVDEQRKVLSEMDARTDALRDRVKPKTTEPVAATVPPTSPIEQLRGRRKWILAILVWIGGSALLHNTYEFFTWPTSVECQFSTDQVKVLEGADGNTSYQVLIPLKEFPYDVQLKQGISFETLGVSFINLLLLVGLVYAYWREFRLVDEGKLADGCPNCTSETTHVVREN